jgi:hypothetical protein
VLNLKYHIVSLVAVFCALGIGIFVGSNLVGNDFFVDQQKQLVTKLEEEFNFLREQNKLTQDELAVFKDTTDDYRLFCEQVFPLIIADKLNQKTFAVIELAPTGINEKVIKTLNEAGAEVAYLAVIDWEVEPDWDLLVSPEEKEPLSKKERFTRLSQEITGLLISGQDTSTLQELRKSGFLTIEGSPGRKVDGVVVLEGSDEDRSEVFNNFDLAVTNAYTDKGIKVVVGECQDVLYSTLDAFKLRPVTTIDNIDSTIGLTSLVFSLQGQQGNYGTGNTADRLIPEVNAN